jgi:putative hydrolase
VNWYEALTHQDMHVHSTFSDGKNTIEENIAQAEHMGLRALRCVDHVRADTKWVPTFTATVRALAARAEVGLSCAVEAKLLDTQGRLDTPLDLGDIDAIYAADHQVPLADGPHPPSEIRAKLDNGEMAVEDVLEAIVAATEMALRRPEHVVIAHLFSVLPKIGLSEQDVQPKAIERLAGSAAKHGASIEIDERWRCPSAQTLRPFVHHGVPLLLSTDSHRSETIGRYDYCTRVLRELCHDYPVTL